MKQFLVRPFNAVKFAQCILLACPILWALIIGIYFVRSQNPHAIEPNDILTVHGFVVANNFGQAGLDEELFPSPDNTWRGKLSSITVNSDHTLSITTPLFTSPTKLTYNGRQWAGYTQKAGRVLPIRLEVRR